MAKQSTSQVTVVHLSTADRFLASAKILGLCWLGALFAVLIPVAHFVLVPAGVLAGIFLFRRNYQLTEKVIEGTIPCPKCAKTFTSDPRPFDWPKHETCPHCSTDILLKRD